MKNTHAFTLIEMILILVMLSASIPPLLTAYGRMQEKETFLLPHTQAIHLARDQMERIVSDFDFAAVADVASTPFPIPFELYRYTVAVDYVQSDNFNQSIDPATSAYKRVEISVTHDDIQNLDVHLSTIIVDIDGV